MTNEWLWIKFPLKAALIDIKSAAYYDNQHHSADRWKNLRTHF